MPIQDTVKNSRQPKNICNLGTWVLLPKWNTNVASSILETENGYH